MKNIVSLDSQSDQQDTNEDNRESVSQPSSNDDEELADEDNYEHYNGEHTSDNSAISAFAKALNYNSNSDVMSEINNIKANILFLNHQVSAKK